MTTFFGQPTSEVASLALEHLGLVGVAIALAAAIGVPVGIALTRHPRLAKPVLAIANVAQTVPSLALFGFLIPLNIGLFGVKVVGGIGPQTAIAALVLYALLPIIRGTYVGVQGVDPTLREAGKAMGMTDRQLLFQVELPLALPVIVSGLRVATVITVGTATIAAAIDAGGLGKFIFRGLRMNDDALILAGAVPAAAIAILADLALGLVERTLAPGRPARRGLRQGLGVLVATTAGLALWLGAMRTPVHGFTVGAKDFTEQLLLGELVAQAVEARTGQPVARRFELGGNLAHEALLAGEVDTYVEYTGTALLAILKQPPMKDPDQVLDVVRTGYHKLGLALAPPLGFDNTFAILVRGRDARKLNLHTVSEARTAAHGWRAGFGPDFLARADGYTGFSRAYGLSFAGAPREMDLSLTYRALRDGQVDLIAGNATDGLIARYDLVQLQDDRHYFPPYAAVPVVREDALRRFPEAAKALQALAGLVSVEEMRALNYAVDGEHQAPAAVVKAFLAKKLPAAAAARP